MRKSDPLQRIQQNSLNDSSTGCLTWLGSTCRNGYGRIRVTESDGTRFMKSVHRLCWEHANGEIPDGLQIDHLCHVRNCVNTKHMRLVTQAQNTQNVASNAGNKTGFRGVSWHKPLGKWQAQAQSNGIKHFGGYFDNPEEAAVAAKNLRNKLMTHNELDRRRNHRQI